MVPRSRFLLALLVVPLAVLAACRHDPLAGLPDGTVFTGDAGAAAAFLGQLEELGPTPIGHAAGRLRPALAACRTFVAVLPAAAPAADLSTSVRCLPDHDRGRLTALRGDADWLFATPLGGGERLAAWGRRAPAGAERIRVVLDRPHSHGPAQLMVPDDEPAAAARLSDRQALAHVRIRPEGGFSFDRLLPKAGGWAERLYGIGGDLFASAALEGTWEMAAYAPEQGDLIPPLAAALAVSDRALAVKGIETLLSRLQQRWPVHRTPWQLAGARGACLADLNVLPGLAPCYVATDQALVIGWNPRSVALALAPGDREAAGPSGLDLFLDRFAPADRLLDVAYGAATPTNGRYPWRRLAARAQTRGKQIEVDVDLASSREVAVVR